MAKEKRSSKKAIIYEKTEMKEFKTKP